MKRGVARMERVAGGTVTSTDATPDLRISIIAAAWAGHENSLKGYVVLRRTLATGDHIRVGFEDALVLPDGSHAPSNAALVAWAVTAARQHGREPATAAQAKAIVGAA